MVNDVQSAVMAPEADHSLGQNKEPVVAVAREGGGGLQDPTLSSATMKPDIVWRPQWAHCRRDASN